MSRSTTKSSAVLEEKIVDLEGKLELAQQKHQRALADYQNLVRRTQQEKVAWAQLAHRELVEELLQPLEHLSMAAEQLSDSGLDMVISQLWQKLEAQGLKEIDALGKSFDIELMEAVEQQADQADTGTKQELVVTKVVRRGYTLNNHVLQHAKVALGTTAQQQTSSETTQ